MPVGSVALQAIERWLEVRPPGLQSLGGRTLFTSNRGGRISVRNIQARLKAQGRRAGMHQDVHPHMLRHSFASHMLESSGDLRAVQELLGTREPLHHADLHPSGFPAPRQGVRCRAPQGQAALGG